MINSKKKGFTIVELVIVIAVVAILAAVLIPTFSNLVKKANVSADTQAVRQMNTALAIYEAENGKPTNVTEAKNALDSQLINVEGGLVPVSKGYAFYWDSEKNEVVLVKYGDEIKDGWQILTANAFGQLINVSSKDELINALNTTGEPISITLTSDITLDIEGKRPTHSTITSIPAMKEISESEVIEIDLNDKTLTFDNTSRTGILISGGNLTIKNGKIVNNGIEQLLRNLEGTLVLKNVVIEDTSTHTEGKASTVITILGISDTTIINSTINSTADYGITSNSTTGILDGARISILGTTIDTTKGEEKESTAILINVIADITIDDCIVKGVRHGMFLRGNNAVIKNSSFECTFDPNKEDTYTNSFADGNAGPIASITLHAGGEYGGDATFNYVFENVTADTIVAGTTENGKIIVSGVNLTRTVTGSNVTVK